MGHYSLDGEWGLSKMGCLETNLQKFRIRQAIRGQFLSRAVDTCHAFGMLVSMICGRKNVNRYYKRKSLRWVERDLPGCLTTFQFLILILFLRVWAYLFLTSLSYYQILAILSFPFIA